MCVHIYIYTAKGLKLQNVHHTVYVNERPNIWVFLTHRTVIDVCRASAEHALVMVETSKQEIDIDRGATVYRQILCSAAIKRSRGTLFLTLLNTHCLSNLIQGFPMRTTISSILFCFFIRYPNLY